MLDAILFAVLLGSSSGAPADQSAITRKVFEHDIALALNQYRLSTGKTTAKAKATALMSRIAKDIPGLVEKLAAEGLSPLEEELVRKSLHELIAALTKATSPSVVAPSNALLTIDLRACRTGDEAGCLAAVKAAHEAVDKLKSPPPPDPEVVAAVMALKVCESKDQREACLKARNTMIEVLERKTSGLAEPQVTLPCSQALRDSREDPADASSTRFEKINNVKSYLAELRTVIGEAEANATKECEPDPALPTEALDRAKLRRLTDDALRIVDMRPRVAAVIQPAVVYDKDQKAASAAAMIRFEGERLSGFRFHGAFGLTPAIVATKVAAAAALADVRTVTSTTTASGTTTTVVTARNGSLTYKCEVPDPSRPPCAAEPAADAFQTSLQNALATHAGLSWGVGLGRGGRAGELNGFWRAGVSHVGTDFVIAKEDGTGSQGVAMRLDQGVKDGAYFEWGGRVAIFQYDDTESPTVGMLRPMVGLEGGRRTDRRLGSLKYLTAAGVSAGSSDKERWFVRVTVTRIPVFSDKGRVFDLSLMLDHEWARRHNGHIPPVTRLFVQGNLDFIKAIKGAN
jgi:hypothetical protein